MKLEAGETTTIPEGVHLLPPPAPSAMIHPGLLGLPPLDPCNMFLAGYADCAHEALRYLTEVEHLPYDHPLVSGLRQHLIKQQRLLDFQHFLRSTVCLQTEMNGGVIQDTVSPCNIDPVLVTSYPQEVFNMDQEDTFVNTETELLEQDSEEKSVLPSVQPECEQSERIMSLAEELFSLLQEECDMLSDSDDEIDRSDDLIEQ